MTLRATTWLAPGLPLRLFELICDYLAGALACEVTLTSDERSSGPMHGDHDPFAAGEVDLGFLCSPSFLYLRSLERPSVDLVPAAPVFENPRNPHDGPVYWSEVIVRSDDPATSFEQLAGRVWGYNDECSLSGYFATLQRLRAIGCGAEFFVRRVRTGSHLNSLEATLAGDVDAAAIDSTALMLWRKERPELAERLRVVAAWGPFPIQPIVVRSGVDGDLAARAAEALLRLECPDAASALCEFGLERFAAIDERAFAEERAELRALGQLPPS